MSIVKSNESYNSSVASSRVESSDDVDTIKVKDYVKELLKSRIFLGRYLERRLSDPRIGYRDVVLLSPAEVDLKRDLIEAQHKLRSVYPNKHWIGITDGELIGHPGLCLWTEIDNQPFGPFWFQIKSLKYREEEIIITVKCIRHINESFLEIEPILTGTAKKKVALLKADQTETSSEALSETYNEIVETLKTAVSIRNIKEFITFLCAFVIAVVTGSTAFINFLGNFVLALIRELSVLIKSSTPMFLGFLDFLSKIVGGFYILLAMFFRPSNPAPVDRRSITNYDKSRRGRVGMTYESFDHTSFD
ncbi:uncharacterized protein LOC126371306 [Pectinophora gossypiella]|uniref:Uncharacterized protein n=1 Tax=Pectinophora gossypiella TaxID=13191 RepID=A0A1E1WCM5_PECGO|nr:uncharacterized protein LOC126371306 [Pectinophora gossypiella]